MELSHKTWSRIYLEPLGRSLGVWKGKVIKIGQDELRFDVILANSQKFGLTSQLPI